jgi:trimeric autotransporter adhesin
LTRARAGAWLFVAAISASIPGCGRTPSPTAPAPAGATVASITVTSPGTSGATFQLTAMARLSDGSSLDVTQTAAWVSSNTQFATVSTTGLVTVQASGETDLRATYLTISGSTHAVVVRIQVVGVTITGISRGDALFQLTATARLSDSTSTDVTSLAVWDSSNTSVATVSPSGLVRVAGDGEVDIRAAYQGATDVWHLSRGSAKTYGVFGVVVGTDAAAIAGANIRLLEPSVLGNPTVTDAAGQFTFSGLASGSHLLEVSKAGYEIQESEIVIVDRTLPINVTLRRLSAGMN